MSRLETVVEALVERLQAEPSVAGAFLAGSLAAGRADDALAEVDAPMPYAPTRIVLDRSGGLARALARVASAPTASWGTGQREDRDGWRHRSST